MDERASFADADETEVSLALYVGAGMDVLMSSMMLWGIEDNPCVTMTEVEGGLQYEGSDDPDCISEMRGVITAYGVDGPGWTMEEQVGERTIEFNNVEFASDSGDEEPWLLHGTIASGEDYIEVDLKSNFLGELGMVENHASFTVENKTNTLTHDAGSWAHIPGFGSFDIAGNSSFESGMLDLAFSGQDTLTITADQDCISFALDGSSFVPDAAKLEDKGLPICEG